MCLLKNTINVHYVEKYENEQKYTEPLQDLLSLLYEGIGNGHGPVDALLNRPENEVFGLPPHGRVSINEFKYLFPSFPLRLYTLKVSESIVILFGGGIKDGPTNQTSSLSYQWRKACTMSRKISESIIDGSILIDDKKRKLFNSDGTEDIIL
jgi:hypothetical protein